MTDIHNHSLYGVDDGAKTIGESVEMLGAAKAQGIDAIVLTPHYRHGMFPYETDTVRAHFKELSARAEELRLKLYLGCEYHADSAMVEAFREGRCETLAGGDYVLAEYSFATEYAYIMQNTRLLVSCGYFPVIAHIERYRCIAAKPERCEELRRAGAVIQINADSVLGYAGRGTEKFCKKVLKNRWADVVASDAHGIRQRENRLGECRACVAKKYGTEYAERLFEENPGKIVAGSDETI